MVTVENRDDVKAFKDYTGDSSTPSSAPASPTPKAPAVTQESAPPTPVQKVVTAPPGGRVFASPLARTLAREASVDLSILPFQGYASGPNGRIIADDVRAAIAAGVKAQPTQAAVQPTQAASTPASPPQSPPSYVPGGSLQELFTQAKRTVPHYFLSVEVNLSKIQSLRKQLGTEGESLSVQDFLVKSAARAMTKVPEVNAAWMDSFVRKYDQVQSLPRQS